MPLLFDEVASTTDLEQAHEWTKQAYVSNSMQYQGNSRNFSFRHRNTHCGSFGFAVYEHSMNTEVEMEPLHDFVVVEWPMNGRLALSEGRNDITPARGEAIMINPDVLIKARWSDLALAILRIQRDELERIAAELAGYDEPRQLRFSLSRPISAEKSRHCQALMRYVTHDFLGNSAARSSPLIRYQVLRTIIATILETFPNATLSTTPGATGMIEPAAVRRAVAFIDESASDAIGLTEVAAAAHVGVRGLQRAFQRHLGTTPMAYLRRVRLERAHHDLLAADPAGGVTVAHIAAHWGFNHPGRFSVEYCRHYGHSPSQTLKS